MSAVAQLPCCWPLPSFLSLWVVLTQLLFILQTFIDSDLMPGMVPRTSNAKMNETHYLTSGSSWDKRTNCRWLWFSG